VLVFLIVGWTCWLIVEQYKEYIVLRQSYIVRSTELSIDVIAGGGGGGFADHLVPRLTTPTKRRLLSHSSPTKDGEGSGRGVIRLHRRDASFADNDAKTGAGAAIPTTAVAGAPASAPGPAATVVAAPTQPQGSRLGRGASSSMPLLAGDAARPPIPSGSPAKHGQGVNHMPRTASAPAKDIELATLPEGVRRAAAAALLPDGNGRHSAQNSAGSSGSRQQHQDWTQYDFSREVGLESGGLSSSPLNSRLALPSSDLRRQPSSSDLRRQPSAGAALRRGPSNAAVAAALDDLQISSAAEALVKIRHHRILSGASGASHSATGTPGMLTPRKVDSGDNLEALGLAFCGNGTTDAGMPVVVEEGVLAGSKRHDLTVVVDADGPSPGGAKSRSPHTAIRNWWNNIGSRCTCTT
jgi:hypothetical protein